MALPPNGAPTARTRLQQLFGIDLRSLAVLRVGLALAILYDTLDRSRDLVAHYTELGVLPLETAVELWGRGLYASPFSWVSHSPELVAMLFALLALSAVAMLVGWRTRLAAALCWFLLVSVQARNPLAAAMGGDKLLRVMLFWSLFLPLGARGSLDALRANGRQLVNPIVCLPGAILLLQVCVMYWTTGWLKQGDTWSQGTALRYALQVDYWVSPAGIWLRDFEGAHALLTYGTRWFELLGPFLAFVPFFAGPVRTATVALFAAFHLGLATFMDIGPFPLICIIAWTAFLPPWFWDSLLPFLTRRASRGPAAWRGAGDTLAVARWAQALAGALFCYVVLQVGGQSIAGHSVLPRPLLMLGSALRINQNWSMFAPDPPLVEHWPVFRGALADGSSVDPLRGGAPIRSKPERVAEALPSFRWRVYMAYLMDGEVGSPRIDRLQQALSQHLCLAWNDQGQHSRALDGLELEYWTEDSRFPDRSPERRTVYRYHCAQAPETYAQWQPPEGQGL